jgi:transcription elongation GreA/GreB family factor
MKTETTEEKIVFKSKLKAMAETVLSERIHHSNQAMVEAQQAANNEDKSTVGDKHETSRAMAMLDREIHARQLDAAQKEMTVIHQTDVDQIFPEIQSGSFVLTDTGNYFFLVGLGPVDTATGKIIFLSINSPIGKVFANKKTGDLVIFNGKTIQITGVF